MTNSVDIFLARSIRASNVHSQFESLTQHQHHSYTYNNKQTTEKKKRIRQQHHQRAFSRNNYSKLLCREYAS